MAASQVAGAQEGRISGQIVSRGQKPIRVSWTRMVQRERAQRRARAASFGSAYGRVIAVPLGEIPAGREAGADDGHLFTRPGSANAARGAEANDPQTLGTGFQAVGLQDQFDLTGGGSIPPDTMGAVGPNHFVENINSSVAIYTKAGALVSHVTLTNFFTFNDGVAFPANGAFDPRILYDRRSGRWFATAMERGVTSGRDNDIALAVSETDDPTGTWVFYRIPLGQASSGGTNFFTDYSTLGTDDNGVYFGARIFASNNTSNATIAATEKASLLAGSPSLSAVTQFTGITDMYSTPQPAHNQTAIGATDPAWFVSSSVTDFADVITRKITWSGGAPSLSAISTVTTPAYSGPINAPASGSTTNVNVTDDRLQMAMIRDGRLWTTRNVGVNSTGGSSGADRTGCEWFELDVSTGTASVLQNGRVFDSAGSDPRFYYFPSIMVSGQGHAAMGFSGSNASEFIGAYTCGRLVSDSAGTMQAVTLIKAGEDSYTRNDVRGRNRWGDYSYTSLDPNDDMTLWTLQEYAEDTATASVWGTWATPLMAPAPTMANPSATANQGDNNTVINLTGSGFFDPGAGFTNRLDLTISGDGISGLSVTYTSPNAASVTFDIAAGATTGARDMTLTNPDGQTVTVTGALTVLDSPPAAPSGFSATPSTGTRAIDLAWTDNATDNTGFTLQRRRNGFPNWSGLATLGDLTSFRDTAGLLAGETYEYRLRSFNALGYSDWITASATMPAPPNAPSGLTATAVGANRINVSWTDNSNDETGFRLERKTGGGAFGNSGSLGAGVTSAACTNLLASTTYTFRVRAIRGVDLSAPSGEAEATTFAAVAAPSNLIGMVASSSRINLVWADNSSDENGFRIERKTGAGAFGVIGTVGSGVTTAACTGLAPGTLYTFRVRAYRGVDYSAYSNEGDATTLQTLSAPADLTATAFGSRRINLAWSDNSGDESGFKVERKSGMGNFQVIATLPAGTTSFSSTNLTGGVEYTFRVRAYRGSDFSAYTDPAAATANP